MATQLLPSVHTLLSCYCGLLALTGSSWLNEKRELSIDPSIPSLYSSAIRIFLPLIFTESFFFSCEQRQRICHLHLSQWKDRKVGSQCPETACPGLTSVKAESGVKLPLYESGTFHLLVWDLSKFLNLSELQCPYLDIPYILKLLIGLSGINHERGKKCLAYDMLKNVNDYYYYSSQQCPIWKPI